MKTKFGEFINEGKAYRISTPYSPSRLDNVLYNMEGYVTELSQWGTGTASIQFEDGETNNVIRGDNKTIYCRDEKTGDVWCPGVYPMMSKAHNFVCEHHDAYSVVSSVYEGIKVSWRTFVPAEGTREIWTVNVTNTDSKSRSISIVPTVRLQLSGFKAPRFCEGQTQTSYSDFRYDINGMFFYALNPWMKNTRYSAALCSSCNVNSYTGSDGGFFGATSSMYYPSRLLSGENLDNKKGIGGQPFLALLCNFEIPAGETVTVDFMMSILESVDEALTEVKDIKSRDSVEALLKSTSDTIEKRRERLIIETPNKKFDAYVNMWLKKGLEYCLRKKDATRDNLQFADGLTMSVPERVREELLKILSYQYADGHTVRSWVPLDETYYCDGPLWIILTTCGYIKYSDDIAFLNEEIPYFDKGSGTVKEHLERCITRIDEDRGPNSLPLARYADWNDALNLPDPLAESVFMAMAFGYMLKEMIELMRYIGENEKADEYAEKHAELKEVINRVAWDEKGQYYVRAFSDGEIIGGSNSDGSKIYVNPQTWAILGEIVTEERLHLILKAVDQHIQTKLGCVVNYPAYEKYDKRYGRISAQNPGTIENGAVYCHATSFKTAADVKLGLGDRALSDLIKIFPNSPDNPVELSKGTPFALTSSYCTNKDVWGEAGRPWLTGTQRWVMYSIVEGLLGVRRTYGGFLVKPAFPSEWNEAICIIKRKGAVYGFSIKRTSESNADGCTVRLNGQLVQNGFVPFQAEGIHEITVEMNSCQE